MKSWGINIEIQPGSYEIHELGKNGMATKITGVELTSLEVSNVAKNMIQAKIHLLYNRIIKKHCS